MRQHLRAYRSTWLEVNGMTKVPWRTRFDAQIRMDTSPADRDVTGDCWTWTGHLLPNGYGYFWLDGAKDYVHRVSYRQFVGPIPEGLTIDHLCRNRACCNPTHLDPVTQRENNLRSAGFAAIKARQTHCIHGHPFDEVNTYIAPNGTRKCMTCRRRVNNASYHRRKAG